MDKSFVSKRMEGESLKRGQVKLIAIRPTTNPNKVQLVFMQNIKREGRGNLLGALNKSDERFNHSAGRPFWVTSDIRDLGDVFGESVLAKAKEAQETEDYVSLDITDPATVDGDLVAIQITETHRARTRELEDIEQMKLNVKQDGNGNYLSKDGYAIFERYTLTYKEDLKHSFIQHDSTTTDIEDLEVEMISSQQTPDQAEKNAGEAQKRDKSLTGEEA